MDLPWNIIIKRIAARRKQKQLKENIDKEEESQTEDNIVQKFTNTRARLLYSEEEILKKLQMTLKSNTTSDFNLKKRPGLWANIKLHSDIEQKRESFNNYS